MFDLDKIVTEVQNTEIVVKDKTLEELHNECFVDLDAEVKPLDVLVYVGIDGQGKKAPAITRGEISCIYAPSKAKKSFNKSLVEAAFIGGNTTNYSNLIVGNRKTEGYVISIDTEQGEFYAANAFRRVERMVGNRYNKFVPFQMRKQSVKDRLRFLNYLVRESKYAGNIDIITIDGLADLVTNTNDIETSAELAEMLLQWSALGLHICFILHKNPNSQKARGHIGSVTTIKCETMISMDRLVDEDGEGEKNTVKISCSHSRGRDFEDFYLTVDEDGLPFTHSFLEENTSNPNKQKTKEFKEEKQQIKPVSLSDAFGEDNVPF